MDNHVWIQGKYGVRIFFYATIALAFIVYLAYLGDIEMVLIGGVTVVAGFYLATLPVNYRFEATADHLLIYNPLVFWRKYRRVNYTDIHKIDCAFFGQMKGQPTFHIFSDCFWRRKSVFRIDNLSESQLIGFKELLSKKGVEMEVYRSRQSYHKRLQERIGSLWMLQPWRW